VTSLVEILQRRVRSLSGVDGFDDVGAP
jgi:hypothetical protein